MQEAWGAPLTVFLTPLPASEFSEVPEPTRFMRLATSSPTAPCVELLLVAISCLGPEEACPPFSTYLKYKAQMSGKELLVENNARGKHL